MKPLAQKIFTKIEIATPTNTIRLCKGCVAHRYVMTEHTVMYWENILTSIDSKLYNTCGDIHWEISERLDYEST